jgi:hypothetical protein
MIQVLCLANNLICFVMLVLDKTLQSSVNIGTKC